ncbi:response regulator [Mesorhizobium sp. YR577]|uniref:response regulator transcription factor n=1 Tax=Mesorhizobium sp. YR577 TaxID=1884373 RepID=UPI000B816E18|nr:response regulator [Mesorhizobium sp. YR577]
MSRIVWALRKHTDPSGELIKSDDVRPRSNYRRLNEVAMPWIMAERCISVAVVDDDESVRRALARLLRSESIEVTGFGSGTEFLEGFSSIELHCVILDLHMPNLDGFDVLRHFARLRYRCPVIVMTGHDSTKARAESFALGAVKYLAKPFDAELLVTMIRQIAADGEARS